VGAVAALAASAGLAWAVARLPPTARVVIRSSDVRGYQPLGAVADLAVDDLRHCFGVNRLLARAPSSGISGTGSAHSDPQATTGASFARGSIALNGEYDIESFAWLGSSTGQARGAFDALVSARFERCLGARLQRQYTGLGTPAHTRFLALPAPRAGDRTGAFELQLTVYSDAAGAILATNRYDFDAIWVGRMAALLETDGAGAAPPDALAPFPRALQARLVRLLAARMAAVQHRRPVAPRRRSASGG
jgi:hypothetical protein